MLDVVPLLELAKSHGYRPFYDQAASSLKTLLSKLASAGIKPSVLLPGNDLYSHALEIEQKEYVFQVMIRFDLHIFAIVAYRKSSTARYFVSYGPSLEPMLKPLLDIIRLEGFEEVDHNAGNISLGDEPLAQGMMANTLFAYFFEDG